MWSASSSIPRKSQTVQPLDSSGLNTRRNIQPKHNQTSAPIMHTQRIWSLKPSVSRMGAFSQTPAFVMKAFLTVKDNVAVSKVCELFNVHFHVDPDPVTILRSTSVGTN